MCRSLVVGGRRCPSDTTLARCVRGWHEPRTYASYAGLDQALTPTVPEGADRQRMLASACASAKEVIGEFNERIAAGDMDSVRDLAVMAGSSN